MDVSKEMQELMQELDKPLPRAEIEWRVQSSGISRDGKPWVQVAAYTTARGIQNRLDTVVGPHRWKNEEPRPIFEGGKLIAFLAGISIWFPRETGGEWITKWDGAECTDFESFKGGLSGAMKRAAVMWGVGRYLYNVHVQFAELDDKGKYSDGWNRIEVKDKYKKDAPGVWTAWREPRLPDEALPENERSRKQTTTTQPGPTHDVQGGPPPQQTSDGKTTSGPPPEQQKKDQERQKQSGETNQEDEADRMNLADLKKFTARHVKRLGMNPEEAKAVTRMAFGYDSFLVAPLEVQRKLFKAFRGAKSKDEILAEAKKQEDFRKGQQK